jgi:uncharacterized protein (TIGR02246 family)
MRHSITVTLLATAAIVAALGGCTQSAANAGGDGGDAKKAVQADEAKLKQQMSAKDNEGVLSHYADDAYFVVPGTPPADGSTAIRQVFANASTDPAFKIDFTSDKIEVSKSGDMAYSRGKFTEQHTDSKTGKVMSESGSYLTVYRKQDDGSWKIVDDFAVADPGAAKPVPPKPPATRAKMTSF